MKKVGDLTIRELAEMCYNIRYCKECELYPWCNQQLSDAPGKLVINNALEFEVGCIMAKEVQDEGNK